jgi:hypothetical protein
LTLSELVSAARTLAPDARARVDQAGRSALPVTGVTHDSRAVTAGTVFVAIRGQRADGAQFAAEAVRRGAAAIIAETAEPSGMTVPWLRTPDARVALAEMAALVYGRPSEALKVIGVTGTNGKTDLYLSAGSGVRRRGHSLRAHRHGHRSRGTDTGGRARRLAHDSGSARSAAAAARNGGPRLRRLRDGGVIARACAAALLRGCGSPPGSSPTSLAITSTFTWTCSSTLLPSAGSSKCCRRARRRWSTSTIRGDSSSRPACRPW